jgi:hypothetical protein
MYPNLSIQRGENPKYKGHRNRINLFWKKFNKKSWPNVNILLDFVVKQRSKPPAPRVGSGISHFAAL